jgi:hypothetical protein
MRTTLFALALVAAGCSGATTTRTVTGQLRTSAPVTAQSTAQQQYVGDVSSSGRFTLQLPTGASYELFVGKGQLDWPTSTGPARWAKLGGGPTLDLGHVSKRSDGHYTCDHQASDDDHCDRDDNDDGGDDDHGDDDGEYGGDHHACDGGAGVGGGTGTGGGGGTGTGGGGIP